MSTSDYIDALLEQYLDLLDQYTSLRNELNTLQSSVYHHLSRANFSAERGIRYGQDFYDERMQASTTLDITTSSSDELYKFSVKQSIPRPQTDKDEAPEKALEELHIEDINSEEKEEDKPTKVKPHKNPLAWFGVLTPGAQSLRSAQTASVSMISTLIPQIAALDCEMKELEIRIRRARKFRTKAEAEILKGEKLRASRATAVPNKKEPEEIAD